MIITNLEKYFITLVDLALLFFFVWFHFVIINVFCFKGNMCKRLSALNDNEERLYIFIAFDSINSLTGYT